MGSSENTHPVGLKHSHDLASDLACDSRCVLHHASTPGGREGGSEVLLGWVYGTSLAGKQPKIEDFGVELWRFSGKQK